MARKPRIEFPGAVYHVTSRGNAKADIFDGDDDRVDFLRILADTVERCRWVVTAYCLMDNHYHLLVETPEGNLGKGMQLLSGTYTTRFNRRRNRVGHVFQGRYKAILVEKDSHLLAVARYVVLNPVKANMVESAADYIWSSYLATIGKVKAPKWLDVDGLLANFHSQRSKAVKAYVKFAQGDSTKSPFESLRWGVALGSDSFLEELKPLLEEASGRDRSSLLDKERPSLINVFSGWGNRRERDELMCQAHDRWGYTLEEIGKHLGLHYTSVSRAMKRLREK
jgi:REP element-mobilizing transposase RayT